MEDKTHTKSKLINKKFPLGKMTFKELTTEWNRQRRLMFLEMNQTMTYEEIGALFGITRQAVGLVIGKQSGPLDLPEPSKPGKVMVGSTVN